MSCCRVSHSSKTIKIVRDLDLVSREIRRILEDIKIDGLIGDRSINQRLKMISHLVSSQDHQDD